MGRNEITQSELKYHLHYDDKTGVFTWLNPLSSRVCIGQEAGSISRSTGYKVIGIGGHSYRAHRLAFLYMNGCFPESMVDHIDGDRLNNKFENLRPVNKFQNMWNMGSINGSASKFCGVFFEKKIKKWRAHIRFNGKRKHLGVFKNEVDAAKAYDKAALEFHGEFAKLNF